MMAAPPWLYNARVYPSPTFERDGFHNQNTDKGPGGTVEPDAETMDQWIEHMKWCLQSPRILDPEGGWAPHRSLVVKWDHSDETFWYKAADEGEHDLIYNPLQQKDSQAQYYGAAMVAALRGQDAIYNMNEKAWVENCMLFQKKVIVMCEELLQSLDDNEECSRKAVQEFLAKSKQYLRHFQQVYGHSEVKTINSALEVIHKIRKVQSRKCFKAAKVKVMKRPTSSTMSR